MRIQRRSQLRRRLEVNRTETERSRRSEILQTIVDGGNTNFHDDVRRHAELAKQGIRYVDAGVSGGIWGLANGFCLMVGGEPDTVRPLEPIFRSLAPVDGYLHTGGPGSGHYVKMIHNGIEYGMMQAFAEGFDIMKSRASNRLPQDERYDLNLADIAEVWRRGSSSASGCSSSAAS